MFFLYTLENWSLYIFIGFSRYPEVIKFSKYHRVGLQTLKGKISCELSDMTGKV
jgi:hypothetical protein